MSTHKFSEEARSKRQKLNETENSEETDTANESEDNYKSNTETDAASNQVRIVQPARWGKSYRERERQLVYHKIAPSKTRINTTDRTVLLLNDWAKVHGDEAFLENFAAAIEDNSLRQSSISFHLFSDVINYLVTPCKQTFRYGKEYCTIS